MILPMSASGWAWFGSRRSHNSEPARRWTVEHLAREVGTSRTVLAERLNAILGQAPIEYVTCWRMQLAAERMRNSNDSIGDRC